MLAVDYDATKSLCKLLLSTELSSSSTITSRLIYKLLDINSDFIAATVRITAATRATANVNNSMSDSAIETGSAVSHETSTSISQLNDKYENLQLEFSDKETKNVKAANSPISPKSPKSPIYPRLPHQSSLGASVDVEDRKSLREALYQGIFHRHRRTIFAVGSFLRMLRTRSSQYNTIRTTSEAEDVDQVR